MEDNDRIGWFDVLAGRGSVSRGNHPRPGATSADLGKQCDDFRLGLAGSNRVGCPDETPQEKVIERFLVLAAPGGNQFVAFVLHAQDLALKLHDLDLVVAPRQAAVELVAGGLIVPDLRARIAGKHFFDRFRVERNVGGELENEIHIPSVALPIMFHAPLDVLLRKARSPQVRAKRSA